MSVFDPGSWHRVPETFVSSWVIWMSFVLMRWLWVGSWMAPGWGLVTGKTKPRLEAWNFQPHLLFSWKGRRAENGINDWSCLCDDVTIKVPKVGIRRASRLVKHAPTGRAMHPNCTEREIHMLGTLPDLTLCISSSGCSSVFLIIFFNKLDNVSKMFSQALWATWVN